MDLYLRKETSFHCFMVGQQVINSSNPTTKQHMQLVGLKLMAKALAQQLKHLLHHRSIRAGVLDLAPAKPPLKKRLNLRCFRPIMNNIFGLQERVCLIMCL